MRFSPDIPPEENWEEEFDNTFVREDGLMDKYYYDENGDPLFAEEAIKRFIISLLKSEHQKWDKKNAEASADYAKACIHSWKEGLIAEIEGMKFNDTDKSDTALSHNNALDDVKKFINKRP